MLGAIRHRGPDDGASTPLDQCVLGHRRLRVIDLETGQQPVTDESGEIVAVFNGEIYNFQALREELAAKGHRVRGTGDTPIIPHLYEEHGERFVERLYGMFALALWDGRRRRLVLARDRVGKKPLLWTRLADGTLAFASELKALMLLPWRLARLDLGRARRVSRPPGIARCRGRR
jgi:asparagine synthase (glutamine-hydrolysing)